MKTKNLFLAMLLALGAFVASTNSLYADWGGHDGGWGHDHGGDHGGPGWGPRPGPGPGYPPPPPPNYPPPYYPPGNPGYAQPVTQVVQRSFIGGNSLYLSQFFRLDMYRNMRIRSVTIRASTNRGMGQASFCSYSGCSYSQQVATYLSNYSFFSNDVVDNNMRINLQGEFWIDSITIEFQR